MQCGKDDGGGLLDDFQALGEQGSIAVVQVDVVSGGGPGFETNRVGDHKGDSLGFGLTDNLGCGGAALGLVQHKCASSCTRVENSSAEDWPGSKAIFPP